MWILHYVSDKLCFKKEKALLINSSSLAVLESLTYISWTFVDDKLIIGASNQVTKPTPAAPLLLPGRLPDHTAEVACRSGWHAHLQSPGGPQQEPGAHQEREDQTGPAGAGQRQEFTRQPQEPDPYRPQ